MQRDFAKVVLQSSKILQKGDWVPDSGNDYSEQLIVFSLLISAYFSSNDTIVAIGLRHSRGIQSDQGFGVEGIRLYPSLRCSFVIYKPRMGFLIEARTKNG
ncbi:uncharacterized protein PHALS_03737 [Plasmopara halstedii]|uniref:Uncharacterized protein n=1 Tax=Plasmopara halstedii TaxID=4781 RepID=A0A0P1AYX7_PLAHL|nr:uncharacterized protein PHALS_03737 [Plasmopara halstedii]CEG47077.1 hypothetical protein PHALS_03737 [Plasmopara halstedii]|eukprot:XP_024583446.1 hypothetical protein PHALS_03737 [Plasmopara halstedii]